MKIIAWEFLGLLILAGCGGSNAGSPTPVAGKATYTSLVATIFQPKCYPCHTGATPAGDDDFSNYTRLIKSDDIVSGNPEQSVLYQDLQSGKMPKGGTPLSAQEIQLVYDWIKAGLPQN